MGKGTVFRRFGSRAALAQAVLSESESEFQETIIRGAATHDEARLAIEKQLDRLREWQR